MDIVETGKRAFASPSGNMTEPRGHQDPHWETILNYLRQEGAPGATMVGSLAGFGGDSKLHTARLADLAPVRVWSRSSPTATWSSVAD